MLLVLFNTIDRAISGATIPSQSGPGSNGNEEVLHIPQSPCNTGTSPSKKSTEKLKQFILSNQLSNFFTIKE